MLKSGLRTSWATPATSEPMADMVSLRRSDSCSATRRVMSRTARIMRSSPTWALVERHADRSPVRPPAPSAL